MSVTLALYHFLDTLLDCFGSHLSVLKNHIKFHLPNQPTCMLHSAHESTLRTSVSGCIYTAFCFVLFPLLDYGYGHTFTLKSPYPFLI